jgi:hypothetical protein
MFGKLLETPGFTENMLFFFLRIASLYCLIKCTSNKKKKETSELNALSIVKRYLLSRHDALQKQAYEDVQQVFLRMFKIIAKTGANLIDTRRKRCWTSWV